MTVFLMTACSGAARDVDNGADAPAAPLAGLPAAASVDDPTFATGDRCAACHGAGGVMFDEAGRDVSPVTTYATSMMALAARDPYWLAVWSGERVQHPAAAATIDDLCTRCHAPMGARALAATGARITLDTIVRGDTDAAHLARDGVGCTTCHQMPAAGLGAADTYDGQFAIAPGRMIFGPHADPFPMPMQRHVGYTPVEGDHVASSELCASCHTVITRALDEGGVPVGPEVNEQVTFLEWQASGFARDGITCQACHTPTTDLDGRPLAVPLSPMPGWLAPRSPIGRHELRGANSYMLALLAENVAWTGAAVTADALWAGAAAAEAMGQRAAMVAIEDVTRDGARLRFAVRVTNLTGHKLPTGYPGRRMWLDVRIEDAAGAVVFESGRVDDGGHLVDGAGARLDGAGVILPHRTRITAPVEVAVWEGIQVTRDGAPTHHLLDAWGFGKDNRLLPRGWEPQGADAARTVPVGVDGDGDFVAGSDTVAVDVAAPAGGRIVVALRFQSVPPAAIEAIAVHPTPSGAAFRAMAARRPPSSLVLARAERPVP